MCLSTFFAPSAVVYDSFPLRANAHPVGDFLSYRKEIFYTIKKGAVIPLTQF